jgi:hypothetical protein
VKDLYAILGVQKQASYMVICLWVILGFLGDACFKKSGAFGDWRFCCGAGCYCLCSLPAFLSYRSPSFLKVVLLWDVFSVSGGVLLAMLLFKERVTLYKGLMISAVLLAILFNRLDSQDAAKRFTTITERR